LQIGFLRMSGRLLDAVRMVPPVLWRHLGARFGVAAPDLASLRAMPAELILNDVPSPIDPRVHPHMIIDGRIVPKSFGDAYLAGEQAKIPLLLGTDDNEAIVFSTLRKETGQAFDRFGQDLPKVLSVYDPKGTKDRADVAEAVMTDMIFAEPFREFARASAKGGQPTYHYEFGFLPEAQRGKLRGAPHGAEVAYLFGATTLRDGTVLTKNDLAYAEKVRKYWANFAKTGSPNGPGLPAWPQFRVGDEQTQVFGLTGIGPVKDYKKEKLDVLKQERLKGLSWPIAEHTW
jgi:para-nitrobenzyl esterase